MELNIDELLGAATAAFDFLRNTSDKPKGNGLETSRYSQRIIPLNSAQEWLRSDT